MNLLLVQAGQSTWERDGRFEAPTGAPLTEEGFKHAMRVTDELRAHDAHTIYASDADAEQQTAKVIGHHLHLRMHTEPALNELDFGLWQGLLIEDVRLRQPRIFRQWIDDPNSTCPPGGETLQNAQERLCDALSTIMKRSRRLPSVVVLRPIALGLIRCHLTETPLTDLWDLVDRDFRWQGFDVSPEHF